MYENNYSHYIGNNAPPRDPIGKRAFPTCFLPLVGFLATVFFRCDLTKAILSALLRWTSTGATPKPWLSKILSTTPDAASPTPGAPKADDKPVSAIPAAVSRW